MSRRSELLETSEGSGWITTFADLMTLLLVFFVLLFSMSTVENERFARMLVSLKTSFGNQGATNAIIELPRDAPQKVPNRDAELTTEPQPPEPAVTPRREESATPRISDDWQGLADQLRRSLATQDLESEVAVKAPAEGKIVIQIRGQALFDSGSTFLDSRVDPTLDRLMQVFRGYPDFRINIQGHTDNIPISTPRYASNWELSALRATTVLRYLIDQGLSPERLTATGYADSLPLTSNATEAGRARNRRIEFVLEKRQALDSNRIPQDRQAP